MAGAGPAGNGWVKDNEAECGIFTSALYLFDISRPFVTNEDGIIRLIEAKEGPVAAIVWAWQKQ